MATNDPTTQPGAPKPAAPEKVDRRVQRTRQDLHLALQSLILEKRYDKITVQDIIDRANVGRSTFYSHFLDKADLLEHGLRRFGDQFHQDTAHSHDDGHVVHSLVFFHHAHANQDMYRSMISGGGADFLLETGRKHITENIQEHLDERYESADQSAVPLPFVAQYLAGAMMSVLTWWIAEGMSYSPEQMNEMFQALAAPSLQALS